MILIDRKEIQNGSWLYRFMNWKVHISECCFCVAVLVLARVAKGRIAGLVGLEIVAQFASTLGPFIQIPYRELFCEVLSLCLVRA